MQKQNRNTWLFIGFLLLAGVMHSRDPDPYHFLVTAFYCVEYLIYAGLILCWMQSVNRRLLPTRAKNYLLAAVCLMILFVGAQFTKYRIAIIPALTRYCWYVYYLPILLVPTFFLMTCIRLGWGSPKGKPAELLLLIPALALAAGVLTNDLHAKAFIPDGSMAELIGSPNTYSHGFLFYAAYAWAGCTMAAGIFFLLAACKKSGSWKKAVWPLIMLALIPVLLAVRKMIPKMALLDFYEWPEIVIFCMLGMFEACIRNRLLPSNDNYPGFFAQTDLPILITDRNLGTVFRTKSSIPAEKEQLKASLIAAVYPVPDIRLTGMEIRAGYAFRTEDECTVNRLNDALREANEVLAMENEILEKERELTAEQAGVDERSRLYRKAAQEVYPVQKKISGILENARPGTPFFRYDIEKALVLTAFVKRKANFVLVEAERETISADELAAALEESAHYLHYCGMNAVVDVRTKRAFPCRKAMAVYDCFEAAAEAFLSKTEDLFICLQDQELLIMAETGADSEETAYPAGETPDAVSGFSLPVRQFFEDGQTILKFELGGAV